MFTLSLMGSTRVLIVLGLPSPCEEVEKLVKLRLPNLRLCVASRPELDIKGVLQPLQPTSLSLHDEEGQKNAIRDYIEHVVHSDQNMGRWGPEVKYLVINTLSGRAGGISATCSAPCPIAHIIYLLGSGWCPTVTSSTS